MASPVEIGNGVAKAQCAIPCATRVAATETRKTKSAAPAIPAGNMENSLCTNEGYLPGERWTISKGGAA